MDELNLSLPLASDTEAMTPLQTLLESFRTAAKTEREKGTYFENLIVQFFKAEPYYRDQYSDIWPYGEWAKGEGKEYALDATDDGIDLVAKTRGTEEYHAIQCKFYDANHTIAKGDIDSFFTASGQAPFVRRIIVSSTDKWGKKVEPALPGQHVPVTIIDLAALEASQIDWSQFIPGEAPVLREPYVLKPHQEDAVQLVCQGLESADRGKMIMACGTGKTFVSLKIAEKIAGPGKRVLFLVPSLALMSQTLTEWTQQKSTPIHCFAVCSDSKVGKKRRNIDDPIEILVHELRYPATTTPDRLAAEMAKRHDDDHMSVVFSTYHSIEVLNQAQHNHGLAAFDLIVCDEAHRTTGVIFEDIDESHFVRVHDNEYIWGSKRLYMTAAQWLKLLLAHIPDKYEHLVRYYGFYSNRARGERKDDASADNTSTLHIDATPTDRKSKANWARLIQKVYEVEPLECPRCHHTMRIIAVIDEAAVIRKILKHLHRWEPLQELPDHPARDPPWPDRETIPLTYHPVPDIA